MHVDWVWSCELQLCYCKLQLCSCVALRFVNVNQTAVLLVSNLLPPMKKGQGLMKVYTRAKLPTPPGKYLLLDLSYSLTLK